MFLINLVVWGGILVALLVIAFIIWYGLDNTKW